MAITPDTVERERERERAFLEVSKREGVIL